MKTLQTNGSTVLCDINQINSKTGNKTDKPLTIASFLFILIYMATQGQLHSGSLLAVTISHPFGYSCGDHDLTQDTVGLTYKYLLIRA